MLQVEVIFFNKMGVLEALLVLSHDWPGDSTLNQIFHVPSKKPCRKLIGRVSFSTFMTKNFSLYTIKNLTSAFSMRYSMCPRLKHNSKSTKFGFSEGYPQQTAVLGLSIHMLSTPFTLVRGISPKSIWVANRREKITPGYLLSCCLPLATHSFSERLLWSGAHRGPRITTAYWKPNYKDVFFLIVEKPKH